MKFDKIFNIEYLVLQDVADRNIASLNIGWNIEYFLDANIIRSSYSIIRKQLLTLNSEK